MKGGQKERGEKGLEEALEVVLILRRLFLSPARVPHCSPRLQPIELLARRAIPESLAVREEAEDFFPRNDAELRYAPNKYRPTFRKFENHQEEKHMYEKME